jgi:hypothetical protein
MKTTFTAPTQRKPIKRPNKKMSKSHATTDSAPSEEKPWDEVRKLKVARAKKLLQDANYPSPEVIRSVADLLARNWHKPENS